MTTVVAFMDHLGNVGVASERQVSSDVKMRVKKLARSGRFATAGTGLALIVAVLRDLGEDPGESAHHLAARVFKAWEAAGQPRTGAHDKTWNMSFLMIEQGQKPWRATGDQSVYQVDEGYDALGTGAEVAIGVLHAARKERWSARKAVKAAIEAAIAHDIWSSGPIDVVVFKPPDVTT